MKLSELARKVQKWWMCDFCGGMADSINFNMFVSVCIGSVIGVLIGLLIWKLI